MFPSLISASLNRMQFQFSMHPMARYPIRIFHFDIWTFSICMKVTRNNLVWKISNSLVPQNNSNPFFSCMLLTEGASNSQWWKSKLLDERKNLVKQEKNSLKCVTFVRFLFAIVIRWSFKLSAPCKLNMSVQQTFGNAFRRILLGYIFWCFSVQCSLICDVDSKSENNSIT